MRQSEGSKCPLCGVGSSHFTQIEGVDYFECKACDFIFAAPELLDRVDAGEPIRRYDEDYWNQELEAARQRSYGSSLARVAEAILLCRIPVERFVDIGTGPGYLLDALSAYLPKNRARFFGVEKFPPPEGERSRHENYLCCDLGDVGMVFQCGTCVEVLEHLTPAMATGLARAMRAVSVPGALFLFNTGLTGYVKNEDPGYLDPFNRGHITCWSATAAARIFEPHGFVVHALPGRTWAFVVELPMGTVEQGNISDRIWSSPEENRGLLRDPQLGEVMYLLGRESVRAYD